MMKILALDKNHTVLNDGLREMGFKVEEDYEGSYDEILNKIENYDGIIIRSRIPVDTNFLEKAVNLKFIGRVGAGLENIDLYTCLKRDIPVFNAPEGNRDSVGEHTVGMLLMLVHKLGKADKEVCNGLWQREENRGDEILGKTVGIIGYGNMGKSFAKRLQGFGVKVICYDLLPLVGDENATQVELKELYEQADIISLHTPLNEKSLKMINSDFIAAMKKPFYLINTARGKCVVTKDLVKGLKSGKVKGAALDVHEYEKASFEKLSTDELPKEFRYLLQADNVVLTPHIGGWTIQSKERLAQVIVDKIAEWKKFHNIA